jgi:hypothetical protein
VPEAAAERVRQGVRQQLAVELSRRSRRMPIIGIAAAVAAIGVGAAIVVPLVTSGGAGSAEAVEPATKAPAATQPMATGPTIQLAGLQMRLPPGFQVADTGCLPAGAPAIPIESSSISAVTPQGGCLTGFLVPDVPVPQGADTVNVTGHQAWLSKDGQHGTVSLFVEMPVAGGDHLVELTAKGIPADTLVAIARTMMPTPPPATSSPCADPCG